MAVTDNAVLRRIATYPHMHRHIYTFIKPFIPKALSVSLLLCILGRRRTSQKKFSVTQRRENV